MSLIPGDLEEKCFHSQVNFKMQLQEFFEGGLGDIYKTEVEMDQLGFY